MLWDVGKILLFWLESCLQDQRQLNLGQGEAGFSGNRVCDSGALMPGLHPPSWRQSYGLQTGDEMGMRSTQISIDAH